ncbi:hypothetical protein F9C07_1271398 [Aspergillus flavus]|uniref:Uncharacterized protein n=1 Tax=Aspergillus flavus (strain ATCC 200026 / FGSC A1120 / IAM 13836 / NRRL 3357 / JCM 12722 / SRRC 167) TaxID=332952 RepID=A0A7U2MEZ7_ASPFN|nr:uncharacterized protein G4B84_003342 [Aspergillus flavus NRRL3357]KAF7619428.1 hypothetical protein AFLA_001054 [Aspergillus flavus NRRL3357]QMW28053.1 hypothetical protein G4B84_003342 [Aspergillus flavus NRRL3357]QRD82516.1 hypothetical protein F9C07_1271398 [Aspergillus flavus]
MEDIRPTAKWANRMLRPLSSIYHRLEKHNEILTSIAHSKLKAREDAGTRRRIRPSRVTCAEERCSYSDEEPGDPAWIPGRPIRRRIRHNYSSRGQRNGARRRSRLSIHSPERQKTLPGAIEIATPLITGKSKQPLEPSSFRKQLFRNSLPTNNIGATDQRRATRTGNSSYPAYQGSWKEVLDLSGDTGLVDIAHFLDRIFIKFLSKTRHNPVPSPNQQPSRGARSLLSTAVRCLPDFIAEEQRIQDELEEDCDVDMCDAYFTELEAHYAPSGNGWLPLREAVRAQGIRLVSEMIHKGWITRVAACRLLEECVSHGEIDAFELLLSKQLTTVNTYGYPTAFDPHKPSTHCDDPVHILGTYYAKLIGSRSFIFDELAKLLSRGAMPPEWMVTNLWKCCVDEAIKALSTENANSAAATRMLEAVILSAAGISRASKALVSHGKVLGTLRGRLKDTRASAANTASLPKDQSPCPVPIQDALNNLTSSLITALCGMYIARSQPAGAGDNMIGVKFRDTLRQIAFTIQRSIELGQSCEAGRTTLHSLRRGYVLVGDCMLQCGEVSSLEPIGPSDSISGKNLEMFFLSLACQHDMVKELAELAQQVVKFYERMRKSDQTRVSSGVRSKVSQLAGLTNLHGFSSLLAKVAAETAMGLAESTLDVDDHTWAIEVQQNAVRLQQGQNPKQHPAPGRETLGDSVDLYRWEESIGEWVASTPAAKPKSTQSNIAKGYSTRSPTIACSTSSISSSSSPSQDAASSVTSSAPSVSAKRAFTAAGIGSKSCKRLRSTPVESQTRDSPMATKLPFAGSPIAARTRAARGALGDLVQPKVLKALPINTSFPTTRVEVVIVNKNVSALDPMTRRRHCRTTDERTDSRRRKSLSASLEYRGDGKQASAPRITRRTIPCSQDEDSDDELSFL